MRMRYVRVRAGKRGTDTDNRPSIAGLQLLPWEQAATLDDDATVLVPVDKIRYPHVAIAEDEYLVCVLADISGGMSVNLTVAATQEPAVALQVLRGLEAYLSDTSAEVGEITPDGTLVVYRVKLNASTGSKADTLRDGGQDTAESEVKA